MKKTGFVLGVLLVLMLGLVALGEGTVLTEAEILGEGTLLRPYTLLASYSLESIHAIPMREAPDAYLWDAEKDGFVAVQADEQVGLFQFVAVADLDGDKVGDAMLIVPREDSLAYWDADWSYADPRAAEDASYADAFAQAIPYGERMLGFAKEGALGGAAADYHNLVAPGDLKASTYYPAYDFLNSTGTDTLTLLSGFRTAQQTSGWACGVTSATMVLDWYGLRGDLNENDLGALRDEVNDEGKPVWGGATDVQMLINAFDNLNEMAGEEIWQWTSTYDFVGEDGSVAEDYLSTDWILGMLGEGKPVMIGWNSFGGHWQIIIGYDTMGTDIPSDDVLILADPYDSTDHRNDGYNIQSYQRMYYDWTQNFDRDFSRDEGYGMTVMFTAWPTTYEAKAPVQGEGLAVTVPGDWNANEAFDDDMLLPYGDTAADLDASAYAYAKEQRGENGMAGPASSDWYRKADVAASPYYFHGDFFGGEGLSETLDLLPGFKTSQQASEWTCGPAAARMVLAWFGLDNGQTEFDLAALRSDDKEGATSLDGMIEIFAKQEGFTWLCTDDMDEDGNLNGYNLYEGAEDGLIAACIRAGIPMMIGWDEWGGHWQVIIGFDDMGTPETQDDVIILADPYDTNDHNQDGYVVESFERLVYGWGSAFDERGEYVFLIAAPDLDF